MENTNIDNSINNENKSIPRILIIEDNEVERLSLKVALETENFIVDAVETGVAAEELIKLYPFDIAIVDYRLPDVDGLNLIKKIKLVRPELMSLVVTAHNSVEIAVEALKIGAYDYITKPLDVASLLKTIYKIVEDKDVFITSKRKLITIQQSKQGIQYLFKDDQLSIITTPNPDMLVSKGIKKSFGRYIKSFFKSIKNFYWGS